MARTKAKASPAPSGQQETQAKDSAAYTVVARRYRPQRFDEVVGQDHVVQSLRNAIRLGKLSHAYLFSGTRGVGKTSIARIFAKCLNCVQGPTEEPCGVCDICQSIAVGQDVDVIEIDGASNNGVEQVRELRQNASLRPSRARYKIYYIDEVHMLSTGAFNALLKTLEEPPPHVKFFFATTEPNKIPITVLSRCQRYEFASIAPEQIVASLAAICERENVEADRQALQVVARRAGGSMRDAQSLLEQLLATGGRTLTAELVHQALGIAPDERVLELMEALADHDTARALQLLDAAVSAGVQPAEMLSALLEFLRDVLVLAAGAQVDLLAAPPSQRERMDAIAQRWGLDTVLAAQQILAEARLRLRGSPHSRLLVELAVVRVARLENLRELGELVARLKGMEAVGGSRPAPEPAPVRPSRPMPPRADGPVSARAAPNAASPARPALQAASGLDLERVHKLWPAVVEKVGVRYGMVLGQARPKAVVEPDVLVIPISASYNKKAEECETPEAMARIQSALKTVLGRPATIRFERAEAEAHPPAGAPTAAAPAADSDRLRNEPLAQKAVELFEARLIRVDTEDDRTE